jgi:hypothetical protein
MAARRVPRHRRRLPGDRDILGDREHAVPVPAGHRPERRRRPAASRPSAGDGRRAAAAAVRVRRRPDLVRPAAHPRPPVAAAGHPFVGGVPARRRGEVRRALSDRAAGPGPGGGRRARGAPRGVGGHAGGRRPADGRLPALPAHPGRRARLGRHLGPAPTGPRGARRARHAADRLVRPAHRPAGRRVGVGPPAARAPVLSVDGNSWRGAGAGGPRVPGRPAGLARVATPAPPPRR